jgi:hypothetical protein
VALVDCPWNRSAQQHANVSRYADWTVIAQTMLSVVAR